MLSLLLPLFAALTAAAAPPELVCDPDSVVRYEHHWFRESVIHVEGAGLSLALPWTGKESVTIGRALREAAASAPDRAPAELLYLPDFAEFLTYRVPSASAPEPVSVRLHVEKTLLTASEQDGLVVLERVSSPSLLEPEAQESRLTLLHCRRR